MTIAMTAFGEPARFREHTIATGLKGGYQVVPADLNGDGKPDLIALASGMSELAWYENPGWQRHVIAGGFQSPINLGAWDYDGDGVPEIVLATGFSMHASKSAGEVWVLDAESDPRKPWRVREIDRLPTSHRLRWADFDGRGKVLVNAPLTAADAAAPDFRGRPPLVFYRPGEWKREPISDAAEGVMHGIDILDWDGDGRDEILTASFSGIHLLDYEGGRWRRTEIAKGDPAPWPKCGASDVAVGETGKARFVCSIEPWHGHEVTVYTREGAAWRRNVIDDSLVEAHTIITADLNGDGVDEIVAGYRGGDRSVHIYYAQDAGARNWKKVTLDKGGMAAASCAAVDLNGDGRPDLACIGSGTANLKWYENVSAGVPARAR